MLCEALLCTKLWIVMPMQLQPDEPGSTCVPTFCAMTHVIYVDRYATDCWRARCPAICSGILGLISAIGELIGGQAGGYAFASLVAVSLTVTSLAERAGQDWVPDVLIRWAMTLLLPACVETLPLQ